MPFLQVKRCGDWHMEKLLGYGACGTVNLWRNVNTMQEIAIKKCKLSSDDAMRRWKIEVGMLRDMKHPNIVSYFPIPRILEREYPESCSLGMEYCSAGDLRRFIGSQPEHTCGLPEYHVRDVMGDVGSAIYYLHQQNNMHRDLKPENIVLKPRPDCPERYLYKITDLGYAKDLDHTHGHTLVGTLQYLAPELVLEARRELSYDTEVDFWSFGLVVFECATGFRPFFHLSHSEPAVTVNLVKDKSDEAICAWHDRKTKEMIFCNTIPQPHSLNQHFSNDVALWLRLMLRVDKTRRGGEDSEEWYRMLRDVVLPKKYVHILNTTNMQLMTFPLEVDALPRTVQIKVQQEALVDSAEQLLLFEDGNVPKMTENLLNQLTRIKPKALDHPIIYFFDKRAIEWPVCKSETPDRIQQYLDNENTATDQSHRDGMRLMQIILHDILSKMKTALHFHGALFALTERRNKVAKNLRDELQEFRRTNFQTAGMVKLFRVSLDKDIAEDNSQDNSSRICASNGYKKECEAVMRDLERWNKEIEEGQNLINEAEEILSKTKSSLPLSNFRYDLSKLRSDSLKLYSDFRTEFKKFEKSSKDYSSKALKSLCKNQLATFIKDYWMKAKSILEEALSPQSNLRKTMRSHIIHLMQLERILFAMKDKSQKCKCVSSELQDEQKRRQHSLWNMLQYMKDVYNTAHSYEEEASAAEDMTTRHRRVRGIMDDMMMDADVLAVMNFAPLIFTQQQNRQLGQSISSQHAQPRAANDSNPTTSQTVRKATAKTSTPIDGGHPS